MEYVYGALLLHSAGKEVNEANLKRVIDASGAKAESAKIKALVASLGGVDIDEAIKTAAPVTPAAAPAASAGVKEEKAKKKEEKKEEKAKTEEEAASGLASLFG